MKPKAWREDGWPLCPMCMEDELACIRDDNIVTCALARDRTALLRYLLTFDLFCYRCARETVAAGEARM